MTLSLDVLCIDLLSGLILPFFTPWKAAARALMDLPDLSAQDVAKKAMLIASEMCVYTNQNFISETLITKEKEPDSP
jgi:uncharacterized protein YneF (UPF0154 family)